MSQIHNGHSMEIEEDSSTFECPHCGAEILGSNRFTHEAVCARMHRNGNAQRSSRSLPMSRENSSSGLPYPTNPAYQDSRQAQIREEPRIAQIREEPRMAQNQLMTCPNCEKSIRLQDMNFHMDHECSARDKIPCEFCDQLIPMASYTGHIDNCPVRKEHEREQAQRRAQSASPQRSAPHSHLREASQERRQGSQQAGNISPSQESQGSQNQQERSQDQGSSQGGFMSFLSNLAHAAFGSNRQESNTEQQSSQGGALNFISRLLGGPQTESERAESHIPNTRRRAETPPNVNRQPRNPFRIAEPSNVQNPNINRPTRGTLVRTIERGPGGTVIIRTRVVPSDQLQRRQMMMDPMDMGGMNSAENMGPLGLMLNMLSGGYPNEMLGMNFGNMGNPESGGQEEQGLNKEILNSMAVVKYNKAQERNVDPEAKSCPICLDEFEDGQELRFLWCLHRFHKGCVDQWLEKHTNCPICKKEYSEAEHTYAS